jgi:hypothetical protein
MDQCRPDGGPQNTPAKLHPAFNNAAATVAPGPDRAPAASDVHKSLPHRFRPRRWLPEGDVMNNGLRWLLVWLAVGFALTEIAVMALNVWFSR